MAWHHTDWFCLPYHVLCPHIPKPYQDNNTTTSQSAIFRITVFTMGCRSSLSRPPAQPHPRLHTPTFFCRLSNCGQSNGGRHHGYTSLCGVLQAWSWLGSLTFEITRKVIISIRQRHLSRSLYWWSSNHFFKSMKSELSSWHLLHTVNKGTSSKRLFIN